MDLTWRSRLNAGDGARQQQPASAQNTAQNSTPNAAPNTAQTTQSPKRAIPNSKNAVLVNSCQVEVRNVSWEYADIVPDYVAGSSTGILFLSLRYHRLHPEYVHTRIERLGAMYQLRILLLMCDVADSEASIKEVTKTCLINNMTVVVAWSPQQAGHYLSLYLQLDNKPPDSLKEKTPTDYQSIVNNALTSIKGVNKTDVYQLLTRFGVGRGDNWRKLNSHITQSVKNIIKASPDELSKCPGFGDVKVRRMQEAFNYSFKVGFKEQPASGTTADTAAATGSSGTLPTNADGKESQQREADGEDEIDLLDSDEDALNEVAANFDNPQQKAGQSDQQEQEKEQEKDQAQPHRTPPQPRSHPEEEIDLLDSDEDALDQVAANFEY
ncbi:hypothetical protein E3P99_03987 [Wallemia hederae]|uniref:ERCC1-like central domain-containing protein n=1 Tax=Wallemia hederae TaxID=1540922 RepID=A0A4T0FCE4_9BASI|nr:hypothetical protein E3P99_03987 [Wallemia hederae]